jgi:hypothetical protein
MRNSDAETAMGCTFIIIWVGMLLATLGFWAFIVWAIYRLVMHFTGGGA